MPASSMNAKNLGMKLPIQENGILPPAVYHQSSDEIDPVLRHVASDSSLVPSVEAKIYCLPAEILGKIMLDCEPVHNISWSGGSEPIKLGRVCRWWRDVSLSIPALWSTFYLGGHGFDLCFDLNTILIIQEQIAQCLRLHLTRSRDALLSLDIRIVEDPFCHGGLKNILGQFAQHSHRLRILRIYALDGGLFWLEPIAESLPSLESLFVDEDTFCLPEIAVAPKLRTVEIFEFDNITVTRRFPWAQITTLKLRGWAGCLPELLRFCPQLQDISMILDRGWGRFDQENPRVILSHCSRFEMTWGEGRQEYGDRYHSDDDEACRNFFDSFSLPTAQNIDFRDQQICPRLLPLRHMAPFLERAGTLKELALDRIILDRCDPVTGESPLAIILMCVPRLVVLRISAPHCSSIRHDESGLEGASGLNIGSRANEGPKDPLQLHHTLLDVLLQGLHPQLDGQHLVPRLQHLEVSGVDISVWRLRWKDMWSAVCSRRRGHAFVEGEEMPGLRRLSISIAASPEARRFQSRMGDFSKEDIDIIVRIDDPWPGRLESAVSGESDDDIFEFEDYVREEAELK
ncbi:hypothetical protein Hypma_007271 [Hypsizygus marmoreus]|uniref:Uncharacterized protein n=1 Tax=Hypsizygus marmoreus TaxID=39966 RepID=A0A369K9B7_HYPMA|nr:hypothetical protein Hypma_007271 [Hypsizygus marmoreus]